MKMLKVLAVLAFAVAFSSQAFAQKEMTTDEWEAQMKMYTAKKTELTAQADALQAEIDNLNSMLASMQTYDQCVDDVYTKLLGVKKADVDAFRKQVSELEGKIKRKEGPKDARQTELDNLKRNKISALPEFYTKVHVDLQRLLDEWEEKAPVVTHTVVKGDCLWCIARQQRYYGNGFAWPKIYEANRDQIKNPNLIYPDQNFQIPPLSQAEREMYDKMNRRYKPAPVQ